LYWTARDGPKVYEQEDRGRRQFSVINLRFRDTHALPFTTANASDKIVTNLVLISVNECAFWKKAADHCVDRVAETKHSHDNVAQVFCVQLEVVSDDCHIRHAARKNGLICTYVSTHTWQAISRSLVTVITRIVNTSHLHTVARAAKSSV
jgi:hypothetical protein